MKSLKKKAQESRSDLFISYLLCLVVVVALVGALYGLGVIGDIPVRSSLTEDSKITAASVANIPEEAAENNITNNISFDLEDK